MKVRSKGMAVWQPRLQNVCFGLVCRCFNGRLMRAGLNEISPKKARRPNTPAGCADGTAAYLQVTVLAVLLSQPDGRIPGKMGKLFV